MELRVEPFAFAVPSLAHTLANTEQADELLITGQLQQPSLPCFLPRFSEHSGSVGAVGALGWPHKASPNTARHEHSAFPSTATSCPALTLSHSTFWGQQAPQQSGFHQTHSCFTQYHQSE